eukprot:8735651-Heterocapsa_arctica.AAC.1
MSATEASDVELLRLGVVTGCPSVVLLLLDGHGAGGHSTQTEEAQKLCAVAAGATIVVERRNRFLAGPLWWRDRPRATGF